MSTTEEIQEEMRLQSLLQTVAPKKPRKINHDFVKVIKRRPATIARDDLPGVMFYDARRTRGTFYAEALIASFRYKRTSWHNGVELPGKVMLDPPSRLRYDNGSQL